MSTEKENYQDYESQDSGREANKRDNYNRGDNYSQGGNNNYRRDNNNYGNYRSNNNYNRSDNRSYNNRNNNDNRRPSYNNDRGDNRSYNNNYNNRRDNNYGGGSSYGNDGDNRRSYNNNRSNNNYNRSDNRSYSNDNRRPSYNDNRGDNRSYNNNYNNNYRRDNNSGGGYNSQNSRYSDNSGDGKSRRPRIQRTQVDNNYSDRRPYNNRNNDNRRPSYNDNRRSSYNDNRRSSYNDNRGGGYGSYNNNNRGNYNNDNRRFVPRPIEYKEIAVNPDEELRLNKYLANAGICSRREADEFITAGAVAVNDQIITELGTKVKRSDEVRFNGDVVSIERKQYVLLNKPKDFVTTMDDPEERRTVMDLVKEACEERIYPVGRLDKKTTGVLLLTNDGELASKLTHPKYNKKKVYQVTLDRNVATQDLDKILAGIELTDGVIQADTVGFVDPRKQNLIGIEIHSGKNRIVRRIFEALGYKVIKLDRVFFAGLTKKGLRRGDWRYLTQQEVNFLQMGSFE